MQRTYSLLFLLQPFSAHAQQCVVANEKMNVVYVGIPNPMKIVAENRSCDDLVVRTDNGKVERSTESPCLFYAVPEKPGIMIFKVSAGKAKEQLLQELRFRAKLIPSPEARVAGKTGGSILRNVMKAQVGITAGLTNFEYDVRFTIDTFTVDISRDGKSVFSEHTKGNRFSEAARNAFNTLQSGDAIVFSGIVAIGPDSYPRELADITLLVSDNAPAKQPVPQDIEE